MKIIELPQEKYFNVRNFFNVDYPNLAFVLAVIEQKIPGRIFVDIENNPTTCLVLCSGLPYCFIAGEFNREVFTNFLLILKEKVFVKLICPFSSTKEQINLTAYGFEPIERLQYRYKDGSKIQDCAGNSEFDLIPVHSEETFSLCNWYSFMTSMYGNPENYLKNCIGLTLWDREKRRVASEAHGVIAENLIEIGTITNEEYRGKHLSTIVCNKLIRESIKQGLHPIWTCDKANIASWKVAENQGMDDKMEYTFYSFKN
ncbi:TPA: GNAT family N-acetyltransferase [Legionella pneumophila subsp. pneumophila]|uniref:GNAT family N-acetyltransferase n=1 Tax=Legionella sp. PATHC039 TaxID=2992042 RepID=UPI001A320A91|nr:GNAT family N-acetyltransferase [Legionella sp. PATHC039]MCW8394323.1 GNAT family N-acetyltransferase [Legionella sp. PATHC039]HAT8860267.1 GNAT family N-acetyltransferase [Legionella pneumophila subsp. pneumophila]HAT9652227.1 GNAT family N-acetyltransferase [Legionella pneumophila subsp. pneumophila]HAT9921611.1 GNAT family N-acetyltransferase [Legionella pneumophila subsp. pneumophila]